MAAMRQLEDDEFWIKLPSRVYNSGCAFPRQLMITATISDASSVRRRTSKRVC